MPMRILSGYARRYLLFASLTYLALFAIAALLYPFPETHILRPRVWRQEHLAEVAAFSAAWVVVMVGLYALMARKVEKVNGRDVFLHMGVIAMLGPLCEVLINTFCRFAFGSPLWVYRFLPVHHGDTSLYAFFVWGMYGCHLYFIDRNLIRSNAAYRSILFALILSIDAIALEFVLNLTSIWTLHTFIFYYLPNDVHHLTTIAVVPFYFLGGVLAAEVLRLLAKHPIPGGVFGFTFGFVFTFVFG